MPVDAGGAIEDVGATTAGVVSASMGKTLAGGLIKGSGLLSDVVD